MTSAFRAYPHCGAMGSVRVSLLSFRSADLSVAQMPARAVMNSKICHNTLSKTVEQQSLVAGESYARNVQNCVLFLVTLVTRFALGITQHGDVLNFLYDPGRSLTRGHKYYVKEWSSIARRHFGYSSVNYGFPTSSLRFRKNSKTQKHQKISQLSQFDAADPSLDTIVNHRRQQTHPQVGCCAWAGSLCPHVDSYHTTARCPCQLGRNVFCGGCDDWCSIHCYPSPLTKMGEGDFAVQVAPPQNVPTNWYPATKGWGDDDDPPDLATVQEVRSVQHVWPTPDSVDVPFKLPVLPPVPVMVDGMLDLSGLSGRCLSSVTVSGHVTGTAVPFMSHSMTQASLDLALCAVAHPPPVAIHNAPGFSLKIPESLEAAMMDLSVSSRISRALQQAHPAFAEDRTGGLRLVGELRGLLARGDSHLLLLTRAFSLVWSFLWAESTGAAWPDDLGVRPTAAVSATTHDYVLRFPHYREPIWLAGSTPSEIAFWRVASAPGQLTCPSLQGPGHQLFPVGLVTLPDEAMFVVVAPTPQEAVSAQNLLGISSASAISWVVKYATTLGLSDQLPMAYALSYFGQGLTRNDVTLQLPTPQHAADILARWGVAESRATYTPLLNELYVQPSAAIITRAIRTKLLHRSWPRWAWKQSGMLRHALGSSEVTWDLVHSQWAQAASGTAGHYWSQALASADPYEQTIAALSPWITPSFNPFHWVSYSQDLFFWPAQWEVALGVVLPGGPGDVAIKPITLDFVNRSPQGASVTLNLLYSIGLAGLTRPTNQLSLPADFYKLGAPLILEPADTASLLPLAGTTFQWSLTHISPIKVWRSVGLFHQLARRLGKPLAPAPSAQPVMSGDWLRSTIGTLALDEGDLRPAGSLPSSQPHAAGRSTVPLSAAVATSVEETTVVPGATLHTWQPPAPPARRLSDLLSFYWMRSWVEVENVGGGDCGPLAVRDAILGAGYGEGFDLSPLAVRTAAAALRPSALTGPWQTEDLAAACTILQVSLVFVVSARPSVLTYTGPTIVIGHRPDHYFALVEGSSPSSSTLATSGPAVLDDTPHLALLLPHPRLVHPINQLLPRTGNLVGLPAFRPTWEEVVAWLVATRASWTTRTR